MALSIVKRVPECLRKQPEQRMTAREIANWIFNNYRDECEEKRARSKASKSPLETDDLLIQQIIAEIGAQTPRLRTLEGIKTTETRPRQFYFSQKTDEEEIEVTLPETPSEIKTFSEHDLYPLLSKYLKSEQEVFSLRVDEKKSSNKHGPNGNKWLYPDLVGIQDLGKSWCPLTKDALKHAGDNRAKLWSFEVKKTLNRANVRESYFQTVSNSSWANFGYLVAQEIQGRNTLNELQTLSGIHGIGLIQLDFNNPFDSQIIIPSRERPIVDWNSVDRLIDENTDFKIYLTNVLHFYQTGILKDSDWS